MSTNDLAEKWSSFGWEVNKVDGHNVEALLETLKKKTNKPKLVLAQTIKGKGFSFAENNNDWHHKIMSKKQYDEALLELKNE